MAGWALPMDASSGAPTFTAQKHRSALSAVMGLAPSGRPVGAYSGVRPGTPSTTVTLSGSGSMTWNVAAFSGVFDAESSATAGAYLFGFDGTDTGSINAQGASARTDSLYIQIDDASQDSSGARQARVLYQASSTTAPNTRALVVATIAVPATGGGTPAVSWVAPYFGDAGWQNIATPSSWTAISGQPAQYRITADGFCHLRGGFAFSATISASPSTMLSNGAIPNAVVNSNVLMPAYLSASSGAYYVMGIITNVGGLQIYLHPGDSFSNASFFFDGISYPVR